MNYYSSTKNILEYIKLAKGADGGELITELHKHLPKGASLLELGSGPWSDWNILDEIYEAVGSDTSPQFLEHLMQVYPEWEFLELDAVTIDTSRKFDGIYSNKVLHYLDSEHLKASIQRQSDILNDSGIVCHSFWRWEGSEVFKWMYVQYHTMDWLKELFEDYYDIAHLQTYAEFEAEDSILLIGRKKS